jgi:hypothetical protein
MPFGDLPLSVRKTLSRASFEILGPSLRKSGEFCMTRKNASKIGCPNG